MGLTVKVSGGDRYKAILKKLADIGLGVKAGIPKGATTTDGISIPAYAAYNEFGTSRIPARPFLRQAAGKKVGQWVGVVAAAVHGQTSEMSAWERAMVLTGEQMMADIKQEIQQGEFLPNSPRTIAAKKAKGKVEPDHPLIDTGQMLASVWYEVTRS